MILSYLSAFPDLSEIEQIGDKSLKIFHIELCHATFQELLFLLGYMAVFSPFLANLKQPLFWPD